MQASNVDLPARVDPTRARTRRCDLEVELAEATRG